MTMWTAILSVLLGLAVNECCEVSPWAAKKIARWSARLRYDDPERAEIRSEELVALIEDRPGKLLKLITALCFAAAALRAWTRRTVAGLYAAIPAVSGDGTIALKKAAIVAAAGTVAFTAALTVETAITRVTAAPPPPPTFSSGGSNSLNYHSVAFVAADGTLTGGAFPEQYASDPNVHVAGLNTPPATASIVIPDVPYTLSIWYENNLANDGLTEPRDMSLLVNGQFAGPLNFPVTNDWYETNSKVTTTAVQLPSGSSTLAIACHTDDSCHINVWKIELRGADVPRRGPRPAAPPRPSRPVTWPVSL